MDFLGWWRNLGDDMAKTIKGLMTKLLPTILVKIMIRRDKIEECDGKEDGFFKLCQHNMWCVVSTVINY